jgi:hypothetical protein
VYSKRLQEFCAKLLPTNSPQTDRNALKIGVLPVT